MNIQPIRRPPSAKYPSMHEAQRDPDLLKNVPARWEKAPGFAAMLGLMALAADAGADGWAEAVPVAQAEALPEGEGGKRETSKELQKAMTAVAPMLEEALERDGRGSFGCISVCPATFMPEDEALDLIRAELEAAGLKMKEGVELENVPGPVKEPMEVEARQVKGANGEIRIEMRKSWTNDNEVGLRPVRFDWADEERAVYVDYLTKRDCRAWEGRMASMADSYDFPELAQKVSAAYAEYSAERKTIFGVFFDPLADSGVVQLSLEGLTPEQARIATLEYEKKRAMAKGEKGRERLRAQVRHFVEFLRKEGVVEAGK